jgi:hypothetical protein
MTLQPIVSTTAASHNPALTTFVDVDRHPIVAFLTPSGSCPINPTLVIAHMEVSQIFYKHFKLWLSITVTASIDLVRALIEPTLIPLGASTGFPSRSANIAELKSAPAPDQSE